MKKFSVEIRTTFYKMVDVEAENVYKAKLKVLDQIDKGDIDSIDTENFDTDISGVWITQ